MSKRDEFVGKKFNKWTVVARTVHPFLYGKFYVVRCKCGTVRPCTPIWNLVTGKSKSCGGIGCRVRRTKAQLREAGER